MKPLYFFSAFFLICFSLQAQPTAGTTGLLNIPTAEMQKDGTFFAGANYLPLQITPAAWDYNTGNYFLNITFLPFLEVSYKMTLLRLKEYEGFSNQDRSLSVRFRLLKEQKYMPAVVIGVNDFYSSTTGISGNRYFSNFYFTGTKEFSIKNNFLCTTVGYAPQLNINSNFFGFFGGICYKPGFIPNLKLIAEYDTNVINVGAGILFLNHLYIYGMSNELKRFAGGFSYLIYLK